MEQNESVFPASGIDAQGMDLLKNSGQWAKFIGIVYLCLAGLLVIMLVLMLANISLIASTLMNINGVSQEAIDFMLGAGKWLFSLIMTLSCFTLVLNGYYLARFGTSVRNYILSQHEDQLQTSFKHLGHYLLLTTVLSLGSTLFSLVAILYFLVK